MKVFDVMSTDVVTSGITEALDMATSRMLERGVGCIVVTNKDSVVGIITKGDILRKAFLKGGQAKKVPAKKVMSQPVVTIDPDSTLEEASKLMTSSDVSKLPVVKDGRLVGIITSTDIIRAEPIQVGYLQELVRARFVPHDLR
ncbi:MAG: CBS domain-containing protein [Nitrososphaerota archaeon]|nr:CBS domain-containing protein [Nitrososphaerota archaeon]